MGGEILIVSLVDIFGIYGSVFPGRVRPSGVDFALGGEILIVSLVDIFGIYGSVLPGRVPPGGVDFGLIEIETLRV